VRHKRMGAHTYDVDSSHVAKVWMPFVISALVLAFAGAAGSQLFAAVHDNLQATASPVGDGVISIVRMALTALHRVVRVRLRG
jgi:hypothetical protein